MPGPKYVKDFTFPSDFGFTGSAGQVSVRPHDRQSPRRFAEGGQVKKVTGAQITEDEAKRLQKAPPPPPPQSKASLVDILKGKTREQQMKDLGLKKGGKVKHKAKHKSHPMSYQSDMPHGDMDADGDMDGDSDADGMARGGYARGGKNFIKKAIKHPGALHRDLGVPQGQKIPAKKLAKAAHSDNPTIRRRAAFAKTLSKMHKAMGGPVKAAKGGDIAQDKRMIKTALNAHIRAPKPRGHGVK